MNLLTPDLTRSLIEAALLEDAPEGDLTARLVIPDDARVNAEMEMSADMVARISVLSVRRPER